jgi:hypothetical protein
MAAENRLGRFILPFNTRPAGAVYYYITAHWENVFVVQEDILPSMNLSILAIGI